MQIFYIEIFWMVLYFLYGMGLEVMREERNNRYIDNRYRKFGVGQNEFLNGDVIVVLSYLCLLYISE